MTKHNIKDITWHNTTNKIINWECIKIEGTDMELYYDINDPSVEKTGFNFYCVWHHTWKTEPKESIDCDCMFYGIAYFDGVRHLYYGDKQTENYGYHYYPIVDDIILALKELRKLEQKYCTLD